MSVTKNEHYVPQCYLKKFADKHEQLFAFDKPSKRSFLTHVKNIASETYFHEIKPEVIDKLKSYVAIRVANDGLNFQATKEVFSQLDHINNTEDLLSQHESKFKETIDDVLNQIAKSANIKAKHRNKLAYFMALQFIRTLAFRRELVESTQIIHRAWLKAILKFHNVEYSSSDFEVTLNADMVSLWHDLYLNNSKTIEKITTVFRNHIWYIGYNNTQQPFITSDNPIIKIPCGELQGLGSKGIQIAYPLSPQYIIILLEKNFFKEFKILDNQLIPFDSERVMFYNEQQVFQSRRQIYSSIDIFQFANEICLSNPEICSPKRSNITIKRIKVDSK